MLLNYKYIKSRIKTDKYLLILHGLLGCADNWLPQAKIFSKYYNVIIPDLRNHGDSSHHPIMTYEAMSQDVIELLDHLKIDHTSIIGHSMGGKLVMLLALLYPDRVNKIIIVDIAPDKYKIDSNYKLLKILKSIQLNEFKNREEIKNHIINKIPNFKELDLVMKNIRLNLDKKYEWKLNLDALMNNIDNLANFPEIDKVSSTNTLFLRGDKSDHILPKHYDKIYNFFPNAIIQTISNAGHWVQVDNFNDFIVHSINYLQQTTNN